jgi:hypothetical protein
MAAWCKDWNLKLNEEKARAVYFSHRIRPPESLLALNGQNIPISTLSTMFSDTENMFGILI